MRLKDIGFLTILGLLASCSANQPNTYYLDATNGNDSNSGLSPETAWKSLNKVRNMQLQPGEKILLKRGEKFEGEFDIAGQGTPQQRIQIADYGTGTKPCIIGEDNSLYALRVTNSNYLTIRNLEIVNTGKYPLAKRTGVKIECIDYGISHAIKLDSLTIRDVNGSLVKEQGGGSGIHIINGGDSIKSCFDSLSIENCHILRCARNGMIWDGYYSRENWFPNKHTLVRNNLIEQVPGDGIVPIGCDSTLIEYNVMCDSPDVLPMTEAAAGIWPWSCDNTIIQFNEVSGHKAPWDGQGFDADYNCRNTLIQYNYSHDNYGGMVLICDNGNAGEYSCGNIGSIIRYNISIGDGIRPKETRQGMFSPGIHIAGPVKNTLIERNIIHLNKKTTEKADRTMITSDSWDGYADSTCLRQNIFYTAESSSFDFTQSTANHFSENVYIGVLKNLPERNSSTQAVSYYQEKVLDKDPYGYKGLQELMTIKNINNKKQYIVNKEAIESFFNSLPQ